MKGLHKLFLWALFNLTAGGRAVSPLQADVVQLDSSSSDANGSLWRPQVHFSPPREWMNDPNGLHVDADGTYHLYYQYNPTAVTGGNQHWGHATSDDLYHWVDQPIAISPPDNTSQVFSGSAVIDVNNTSGFFPNQTNGVVAIYTLNTPTAEIQEISYSLDGGYSFTAFAGNPVIDVGSASFRDPKTQSWVMVVAHSDQSFLSIYTSPNLKNWTPASNFSHPSFLSLYECPNLVRIPLHDPSGSTPDQGNMYVLIISSGSGSPLGGSTVQYVPGTFNGTHFTPVDNATRLMEFAKDNYASQFVYGTPDGEDVLLFAWAANTQYAGSVPTAQEGWRGAMTLPRRMFLTNTSQSAGGWDLVTLPVDLKPVLDASPGAVVRDSLNGTGTLALDLRDVASNAFYFEINATLAEPANSTDHSAALTFTLSSPVSGESVSGGFVFAGGYMYINRTGTNGFNFTDTVEDFNTSVAAPAEGTWTLAAVFDRSMLEVFVNGGAASATMLAYPLEPLTEMGVATQGVPADAVVSVAVYGLESVWPGNGTLRSIPSAPVVNASTTNFGAEV